MKRRSWIRPKKRIRRVLWRTGRVIEDSAGMARLRADAYARSGGRCECRLADPARKCSKRVTWFDGHLHHIVSRGRGGSDVIENVAFTDSDCHRQLTGILHWSRPVCEGWAS